MYKKLKEIDNRYEELQGFLSDGEVVAKPALYQKYAKEHSDLHDLVEAYRAHEDTRLRIEEGQKILKENDEELKEIVKEEMPLLKQQLEELGNRLKTRCSWPTFFACTAGMQKDVSGKLR
jgi:peptide chain release factor 1